MINNKSKKRPRYLDTSFQKQNSNRYVIDNYAISLMCLLQFVDKGA